MSRKMPQVKVRPLGAFNRSMFRADAVRAAAQEAAAFPPRTLSQSTIGSYRSGD
jgi:hypothetical protein